MFYCCYFCTYLIYKFRKLKYDVLCKVSPTSKQDKMNVCSVYISDSYSNCQVVTYMVVLLAMFLIHSMNKIFKTESSNIPDYIRFLNFIRFLIKTANSLPDFIRFSKHWSFPTYSTIGQYGWVFEDSGQSPRSTMMINSHHMPNPIPPFFIAFIYTFHLYTFLFTHSDTLTIGVSYDMMLNSSLILGHQTCLRVIPTDHEQFQILDNRKYKTHILTTGITIYIYK